MRASQRFAALAREFSDDPRTKETGGYGIGLSLVKRIVEAHGGSIQMSSSVGEGTSVSITLPPTENGERRNGPRW